MRVILIGVDHELQTPGQGFMHRDYDPAAELRDKARFEQVLADMARSHSVTLVAEEQLPARPSIPRDVATGLKLRHECVEMPGHEREARGIPDDYSTNPHLPHWLVQAIHSERETYWIERIEASARLGEACILVCGATHLASATAKLAARGHDVQAVDVRDLPGFDLRWLGRYSPRV